ncbi:hypothetical protein DPMN_144609 [Dreissena polymorpha]|uniref:Uncharacterized protein n=1 Tax=Dreissena polymorpha TaxID=45954 RepID=A0A9D4F4F5_DREPO|nr:hypothetical protein DPMN_144609 [Dreissena polymorpha]
MRRSEEVLKTESFAEMWRMALKAILMCDRFSTCPVNANFSLDARDGPNTLVNHLVAQGPMLIFEKCWVKN